MGLDAVELVLAIEETFGISISDEDAAGMITPAILISHVQKKVGSKPMQRPCLSQRAFYRVRRHLCEVTNTSRKEIKLNTRISSLFPNPTRRERWEKFRSNSGIDDLPNLSFGRGLVFSPTRVKDLVSAEVALMSKTLQLEGSWTDEEVRSVVRDIIREILYLDQFGDDDEFVRDLGLQ